MSSTGLYKKVFSPFTPCLLPSTTTFRLQSHHHLSFPLSFKVTASFLSLASLRPSSRLSISLSVPEYLPILFLHERTPIVHYAALRLLLLTQPTSLHAFLHFSYKMADFGRSAIRTTCACASRGHFAREPACALRGACARARRRPAAPPSHGVRLKPHVPGALLPRGLGATSSPFL